MSFSVGEKTKAALGSHPGKSIEEFDLWRFPAFVSAMLAVKRAAARSNADSGAISQEALTLLESTLDGLGKIPPALHQEYYPVSLLAGGGGIAVNVNINDAIAGQARAENREQLAIVTKASGAIDLLANTSQSTADACHTAMHVAALRLAGELRCEVEAVESSLSKLSSRHERTKTLARTCLQDAMTITFAERFIGWIGILSHARRSIKTVENDILQVNLGGTVIGNGAGASDDYRKNVITQLAKITGLPLVPSVNFFADAQVPTALVALSSAVELASVQLCKIARDLRLLSSGPRGGFGEIKLPKLMDGSSFFKDKINPVVPETLTQSCFYVQGLCAMVRSSIGVGELELNTYETFAGACLLRALEVLTSTAKLFRTKCIDGIIVNEERCQELADFSNPTKSPAPR